jgi:hypothetical protein
MKNLILFTAMIAFAGNTFAQTGYNYKHPHITASGEVLDSTGNKLGWITRGGEIYNSAGTKIGKIVANKLVNYKGHNLGTIGKDGTFSDEQGVAVLTVDPKSKGEKCQVFDPKGKVIATVHESYKNQACAIHCLYKNMPRHD